MNIKDEYITKTKDYLSFFNMQIKRKVMLEDEIKMLKSNHRVGSNIDFSHQLGIKSSGSYKGIDDLIVTMDTKICCLEAQIERIGHHIMMYDLYTRELNEVERNILKYRYLNNESFERLGKKLSFSRSSAARKHDEVIKKLAFYVFGDDATYA